MSSNWGPGYGDPSHPTTGELPRVGDGRHTDELRTVQVDTVAEPPPQEHADSPYRSSEENAEPRGGAWSMPRTGPEHTDSFPEGSQPRFGGSQPRFGGGSQPRVGPLRGDDTTQFARVGDGVRGSVGPVSVQIDHVRVDNGVSGDTQLLSTAAFMRPQEEAPPAVQAPQPEPGTGSMPAMRHQIGPDWTQTPLRLLAAAAVATAVLAASAASLITIGNWINP
ncbi:hypothetical protein K3N28_18205 [Glycomyces sp. TRM65418]|uniref:hypothetical protein n=1 Tax=Glycomyces sp. TRM65418 TaxID=2867006 RepID=UPI001CE5DAC8|nr:hypothetical protein [Glycomyces sp. TRM65418]MCC3764996.1 hypothetical protein [Glycomyces sp. TRM65418]QZD54628.1 hypothetical protein K3N28_18115 [Glycomyces sp. TRM65418]